MPIESMIMGLGFAERSHSDLDPFERVAWAERVLGFCIYPGNSEARRQYQACKSANRLLRLMEQKAAGEGMDAETLRRYRDEEERYFNSVGGWPSSLNSQGLPNYAEIESRFVFEAFIVSWVMVNLIQLDRTEGVESALSLRKARALVLNGFGKKSRDANSESDEDDSPEFDPYRLSFAYREGTVRNDNHLRRRWAYQTPSLPLAISFGFLTFAKFHEVRSIQENPIPDELPLFLRLAVSVEKFLVTKCPHPGDKPFIAEETLWRFPSSFLKGIKPKGLEEIGSLPTELVQFVVGSYGKEPKNKRSKPEP